RPRYSSGAQGSYALGLVHERYRGADTIHHAGATLGCVHQLLSVPAHGLDLSIISNRMDGAAPGLAWKVVDAVLGDVLAPAVPPLAPAEHEAVTGRWYAPASRRLYTVMQQPQPNQSATLALAVNDGPIGLLRQKDGGYFADSPAHGTVDLRVPAGAGARPASLELSDSGHVERVQRLPDSGPDATALGAELVGRYRYADFGIELAVIVESGKLFLDLRPPCGTARFELAPYSDDVLGGTYVSSWPVPLPVPATLVVERSGGRVSGLWMSTARTRNLWLERCA
ncbi:MAG TPA: hypothetical protein VHE37_03540, partial [Nevskiaceae bacterium]|nr:hypothetical protein [Nevskiaceae bacterium]